MHYLQDRIWHLYQQIKTGPKSKFGPIFFTKKNDIHRFADRYGRKISMPILRNTRTTNTYQVEFRRFKKSVEKFQKVLKNAIFWYCVCSLEMVPQRRIELRIDPYHGSVIPLNY